MRRILRVWPLYYLVVALGFFVLPHLSFLEIPVLTEHLFDVWDKKVLFFVLLFPQLRLVFFAPIPFLEPLWSIGVEEQFYAFWPLVVKWSKKLFWWIVGLVLGFNILKITLSLLNYYEVSFSFLMTLNNWIDYFYFTRLDCILPGCLVAYLFFKNNTFLKHLYTLKTQICVIVLFIIFYTNNSISNNYNQLIYSLLLSIFVLNIATNPKSIIKLNHPFFDFLAKLSFAFYLLHDLAIVSVIYVFTNYFKIDVGRNYLGFFSSSLLLALILSLVSYYGYERYFLKLKTKFSVTKIG